MENKSFEYEPQREIVKIEGMWFSMSFFRNLAKKPIGTKFQIIQRNEESGAITLRAIE